MESRPNFVKPFIEHQVFIVGAEKAGTTLLLALLDGHPRVFTFPFELQYHKHFGSLSNKDYCQLDVLNTHFLSRSKFSHLRRQNHHDKYNAGLLNFGNVDFRELTNYLGNLPNGTYQRKEYFFELAYALMYALGERRKSIKYLIEKPGNHGLDYVEQIFKDFPTCRMIHIVRDPKDNVAALKEAIRKYNGSWGEYCTGKSLRRIKRGFAVAQSYCGDVRYKVIKYEDLVLKTNVIMEMVAEWLGISYEQCLVEPTILGHSWGGNSSSDEVFRNVSSNPIGRGRNLSNDEVQLTELLFPKESILFGYSIRDPGVSWRRVLQLKLLDYHVKPLIFTLQWLLRKMAQIGKYPHYFKLLCSKTRRWSL